MKKFSINYISGILTSILLCVPLLVTSSQSHAELAAPHNAANNIGCSNYCHILPTVKSPYWDHAPADIDDTPTNHLCNSCHTASSGPFSMVNAPAVKTHSSLSTDNSYGNWTIGCTDCHSPHFQEQLQWMSTNDQNIFLASGRITGFLYDRAGETLLTLDPGSLQYKDGWDAERLVKKTGEYRRTVLLPDRVYSLTDGTGSLSFQVVAVDDIAGTITVKGDVTPVYEKTTLPSEFGIIYGQLVRQSVKRNGFAEPVKFFDNTADGRGGFTDQTGGTLPRGICQVCHTRTRHWSPAALAGGDVHYPDQACSDCHDHANGFGHGSGVGTGCGDCHGHDRGYEFSPGKFSQGAGTFASHSTHTENDGDDLKGPGIDCAACHDTTNFPSFKSGTDTDNDGRYSLAETDVCNTCHSPGGSFDGVNDPVIGAKNNWTTGVYSGSTLKSGRSRWCAGCHDESPSNSRADGSGVSARNVIGAYAEYGFYDTGHGVRMECTACHSAGKRHIDHLYTPVATIVEEPASPNPLDYRFFTNKGMNVLHGNAAVSYQLCFSCHVDPRTTASNFGAVNYHATNHQNYPCSFCHDAHGGNSARMTRSLQATDPSKPSNRLGSGEFHILRPGNSAVNPGESNTLYYALNDRPKWNDPAYNVGGAIRTNPPCMTCHFGTAQNIGSGLGPLDTGGGWYLRTYTPKTYGVNLDMDGDTIEDNADNCPTVANPLQENNDGDTFGNACDTCPDLSSANQKDSDNDGFGDACDTCPLISNPLQTGIDSDGDGSPDSCDNCTAISNPDQADRDGDLIGDACDTTCGRLDIDTGSIVQVGSTPSQWNDTEDWAWDIALDPAGNAFVAGYTDGDFGNRLEPWANEEDYFLMKFDNDANGDGVRELLWTRQFGTSNQDKIRGVVVDSQGNAYVSGIDYNQGYYLYKYDTSGNPVWSPPIKVTNPSPDLLAYYGGVAIDTNDMIYVTGSSSSKDLTIIKYNSAVYDGNNTTHGGASSSPTVLWTKAINSSENLEDVGVQVAVDSQNRIYVVGHTRGVLATDISGYTNQGNYDIFLTKYDPGGPAPTHVWTRHLGTAGYDYASSITIDGSDNIYIGGKANGRQFVARYDSTAGNQLWYKEFSASADDFIGYRGLVTNSEGHLLVTGSTPSAYAEKIGSTDCFLLGFDSQGNHMWSRQFGTAGASSFCRAMIMDTDGKPLLTGQTNGNFYTGSNQGTEDLILFKARENCSQ